MSLSLGIPCGIAVGAEPKVEFARDIAPLFAKNCTACHNSQITEGGLNLEDYQSLMVGGDSGDSVVPDSPKESYLLSRVNGQEEPLMPPEDNKVGAKPFSPAELKLLESWIAEGAPRGKSSLPKSIEWKPLPEGLQPIYSLSASSDGHFLAVGRGSQVYVAKQPASGSWDQSIAAATRLSDPERPTSTTHHDIVQSIAISPDSQRIATGGFRNIKIWKLSNRPQTVLDGLPTGTSTAKLSPSGRRLAYFDGKGKVEITDLDTMQATRFLAPAGEPDRPAAACSSFTWLASDSLLTCYGPTGWRLYNPSHATTQAMTTTEPLHASEMVLLGDVVWGIDHTGRLFRMTYDPKRADQLEVSHYERHENVNALACATTPDGRGLVAIGNNDGQVTVWETETQTEVTRFQVSGAVSQLSIDPAMGILIAVSDQVPSLWSLESGKSISNLDADYDHRRARVAAGERAFLQAATVKRLQGELPKLEAAKKQEDESLKKIAEEHGKAVAALAEKETAMQSAAEKQSQAAGAVAAAEKELQELQAKIEQLKDEQKKSDEQAQQATVAVNQAKQQLAERDQVLALAKASAQRAAEQIPQLKQSIQQQESQLKEYESNLADLNEARPNVRSDGKVALAAGKIYVACTDGAVRVFDARDAKPLANLTTDQTIDCFVDDSGLADQGNRRLFAITDGGLMLRCDGSESWSLERSIGTADDSAFSDRVTALQFSPDGQLLAAGSGPPSRAGDLAIINVNSGEVAHVLDELHSDTVLSLSFSPDGRQLASGGADKTCKLIQMDDYSNTKSLEGHTHHVLALSWSRDGQMLATASADKTVKVWNAASGEQLRTIGGFADEVTDIAFVGQTRELICIGADGRIRKVNTADGKELKRFPGVKDALYSCAVTINNEDQPYALVTGGQAGTVWAWTVNDATALSQTPE